MSRAVFQTAQIMPMKTLSSSKVVIGGPYLPPVAGKKLARSRRGVLVLKAFSSSSSSAVVDGDSSSSVSLLEGCLVAPPAVSSSSSSMLSPVMKGQYGAFGAVTLEKGKLDMSQKQSQSSPEALLSLFLSNILWGLNVYFKNRILEIHCSNFVTKIKKLRFIALTLSPK